MYDDEIADYSEPRIWTKKTVSGSVLSSHWEASLIEKLVKRIQDVQSLKRVSPFRKLFLFCSADNDVLSELKRFELYSYNVGFADIPRFRMIGKAAEILSASKGINIVEANRFCEGLSDDVLQQIILKN